MKTASTDIQMSAVETVARVHLLDAPYHIDKTYDYYIPEELRGSVAVGGFVCVPFGGGNKKQLALVCGLSCFSEYGKLKPVIAVVCGSVSLDKEAVGLCFYMKEQLLCSVGEAVKAMIPSSALTKVKEIYRVNPDLDNALERAEAELTPKQLSVFLAIAKEKKGAMGDAILKKLGISVYPILTKLTSLGYIIRDAVFTDSKIHKTEMVSIAESYASLSKTELLTMARGDRQKETIEALLLTDEINMTELCETYEIPKTTVKTLASKGIVSITSVDVYRMPFNGKIEPMSEIVLSPEQEEAKEKILTLCRSGEPKAALLHGITGSGKTKVIQSVMAEVTKSGKQAIMLVPEIALTPQAIAIFRAQYGDKVAVIHSGLSKGERWDAWRRISSGEALVCIGTRSAIFAPMKNLGLIVLDEEQEHTYKSDQNPKYHARDIARYRCAKSGATMLLASATPSLESYKKAKEGKYTLVTLKNRYGNSNLPEVFFVDLSDDARLGWSLPLGLETRMELGYTVDRHEQAILFINQRGYNRYISCPLCGEPLRCRSCSVSYTYHTTKNREGYLFCHYCGRKEAMPSKCPACGSKGFNKIGFGTQFVEEELKHFLSKAKVMRMDADTTTSKFAYEDILSRFKNGEADILLGTQMVTKGHDFPNVTLVGIVNADGLLYQNDYRANERAFDIITQVIGRAGRADKKGKAMIQTYNVNNETLLLAASQNYEKMYENEIALRRSLSYPPFCDILLFVIASEDEVELMNVTTALNDMLLSSLKENPDIESVVYGPMQAPIYKISGIYKMRIVMKCKWNSKTRALISEIYAEICKKLKNRVTVSIDINPSSL